MRSLAFGLTLLVASQGTQAVTLEEQRTQFKSVYKQIQQGKLTSLDTHQKRLSQYPLYPYLEFNLIRKTLSGTTQARIDQFSAQHQNTPLPSRLNRFWLSHLYNTKQWQAYKTAYNKKPVNNDRYQCRLADARLKTGQKKLALSQAKKLWLTGKSQDKTCDALFKVWKNEGHLTSALAHQRFWLAAEQNNTKLAKYIERSITSKTHKTQAQLYWNIRKDPTAIASLKKKALSGKPRAILLTYAHTRWSLKDRPAATESWLKQRKTLSKTEQDYVEKLNKKLALRLAANYDAKAEPLIAKLDPKHEIHEVTEWLTRVALSREDWKGVKRYISKLPADKRTSDRWTYWHTIAENQLNPKKSTAKPLVTLSKERSFYGFLAAELHQQPFMLNKQTMPMAEDALKKLADIPGLTRARELVAVNMIYDANREWRLVNRTLSNPQKIMAGYLALSWGWYNPAIMAAVRTKQWDELNIRFPAPHKQLFKKQADIRKIDRTWPLAIARQESAFLKDARSHAGARGLMQLMPATAKRTAQKHKIPYRKLHQLNQPSLNIALGTAYLGEMYNRFGNNRAFATAAYNAGPHRVKKWLKDRGHLPLDIWIETIPFKETRRYVQNVLAFRVIYDRMSGKRGNLLSDNELKLLALNAKDSSASSL